MAASLLQLSNGHYCLEFAPEDFASVATAIGERFGAPEKLKHPTHIEYRFGGSGFAFPNQGDDPCLISGSAEGDEILQVLCDDINADR